MLRQGSTILAIATLVACSRAPTTTPGAAVARPADSTREQLVAFRLQTACAREARAWLSERERNEGYNPNANGNLSIVVDLGRTHYSLARHACYAVVDQQTTLSGKLYNFNYSRQLFRVDGDVTPVAQISGDTTNAGKAFLEPAGVLVRHMNICAVVATHCDSLATWNHLTRPYLEE